LKNVNWISIQTEKDDFYLIFSQPKDSIVSDPISKKETLVNRKYNADLQNLLKNRNKYNILKRLKENQYDRQKLNMMN
jgi:hypothetical protein